MWLKMAKAAAAQRSGATDRDAFYVLLRKAAREQGMALLLASEQMAALQGVGVLMLIADGEVQTTGERGSVVQLPRRRAATERSGQ